MTMDSIPLLPFILVNLIQSTYGAPVSSYLISSFVSPDPDLPFSNIATYNVTGDIYIGADRRLYQLDSNLTLKQSVIVQCPGASDDPINDNKLLVVAPLPVEKLIVCWNCGDYCETRSLVDIASGLVLHNDVGVDVGIVNAGADSNLYLFIGLSYYAGITFHPVRKHDLHDFSLKVQTGDYSGAGLENNDYIRVIYCEDNIYYLIYRKRKDVEDMETYLGRLCTKTRDANLESYTEIKLTCTQGDASYTVIRAAHIGPAGAALSHSMGLSSEEDILYAVFTRDDSSTSSSGESAVCIYRISDIQQSFENAVTGCVEGMSDYGNLFIGASGVQKCGICPLIQDIQPYECTARISDPGLVAACGQYAYRYASGRDPLQTAPLLTWTGSAPTSIIIAMEREHTIAVIGDEGGNITKMTLTDSSSYIYETVSLGSGSVLKDMFLHEHEEVITVALSSAESTSENKVVRLSLANCNQYQTCEECTGVGTGNPGDPYCGWCTLDSRCSRFHECHLSNETFRWLSNNALECVNISDIQPSDSLPYDLTEQQITITVEQLPDLRDSYQYECSFDSYITPASTEGMTVRCNTPPASRIPTIPQEDDHVVMELSIISTETSVGFVSRYIFFYDCSMMKSCFPCVSRPWNCEWCVYDNRCTNDSTSCKTRGDTIVTKEMGGIETCPQILDVSDDVSIPVQISSSFHLLAKNLPTNNTRVRGYECVLHVEGEEQVTGSTIVNETFLVCNMQEYTYQAEVLRTNVTVTVRWNDDNIIDNRNDVKVTLYKCSVNGGSCSRCLSPDATPTELQCIWCGDECDVIQSNACQSSGTTLNQSQSNQCNSPKITNFFPLSGPKEGNTRIEIIGTDLGVSFQDISVTVADRECDLTGMDHYYQPGLSASCVTPSNEAGISGAVFITVTVDGKVKSGQSANEFLYTDPRINGFSPMEGPLAGGTRITITGEFLDTGRDQRARFGTHECTDLSTDGNMSCVTPASNETSLPLTMTFDSLAKRKSSDLFSFMPNPEINEIDQTSTISAGGRVIFVTGTGFQLIQNPKLVATSYATGTQKSEVCNIVSDNGMNCPTPSNPDASSSRRRRSTDGISIAKLTFDMDGLIIEYNNITYYPDPFYFNISEPNRIAIIDGSRTLELNGTDLDLASTKDDVMIFVGVEGECEIILLQPTSVLCTLPDNQPEANASVLTAEGMRLPAIQVVHGNLKFYPGYVQYEMVNGNIGLIAGCVAGAAVVIIIILVIVGIVINKRRQTSIMQQAEQLELVEKKIQKKVEAAFHDLQLDMSEVEEQVRYLGIPFVNTREYTRKMLFSGLDLLPATMDPELLDTDLEKAMIMFSRQLSNPDFLISFIHQLEEKRKSQRRDRVNIASLITIVLVSEGKFNYFTQTLQTLLEEEISEGADAGRLRALFRRTETIVEKLLSNWISICMYHFLKTHVAKSLYLLYQSVKVQVEKGPIDCFTGQSYFSLNFDCLLEEDVEYNEVTLSVVGKSGQHEYYVKVLDVDCITQVKQKILDAAYRKKHLVKQDRAHEMDLLWYHAGGEERILRDVDDFNSPTDNTMTLRINMVKDVGISDNDRVALIEKIQKKAKAGNYTLVTPGVKSFYTYDEDGTSDVRDRDYTRIQTTPEGGYQLWHLIPEDHMHNAEESKTRLDKEFSAPQLLVTKRTIEPFLQEFLKNIFEKPDSTPLSIKHLFDFFDKMASRYCSENQGEYAEAWKSNSLPQHYWMTTLTHPSYIFNMRQARSADQSISVLANMLDSACKKVKQEKTQDSSLNRVLFLKNVQEYIKTISKYYEDISKRESPSKSELRAEFNTIGEEFSGLFSRVGTLKQLYDFTCRDTADLLDSITELM